MQADEAFEDYAVAVDELLQAKNEEAELDSKVREYMEVGLTPEQAASAIITLRHRGPGARIGAVETTDGAGEPAKVAVVEEDFLPGLPAVAESEKQQTPKPAAESQQTPTPAAEPEPPITDEMAERYTRDDEECIRAAELEAAAAAETATPGEGQASGPEAPPASSTVPDEGGPYFLRFSEAIGTLADAAAWGIQTSRKLHMDMEIIDGAGAVVKPLKLRGKRRAFGDAPPPVIKEPRPPGRPSALLKVLPMLEREEGATLVEMGATLGWETVPTPSHVRGWVGRAGRSHELHIDMIEDEQVFRLKRQDTAKAA